MSQPNFLIGQGELLTTEIKGTSRFSKKTEVYSLNEAKQQLIPQVIATISQINELAPAACPRDFAVARITLNPGYIAKSYFPTGLLRSVGLESIGSRTVNLTPRKWAKKGIPTECSSTELFVAGKRASFTLMTDWINQLEEHSDDAIDFSRIESFSSFSAQDKIRFYGDETEQFFEVGIHLIQSEDYSFIQIGFDSYATQLGIKVHSDLSFQAGNIWFVPVEGARTNVDKLANFTFVRVIRPVPIFRGLRPIQRSGSIAITCQLPMEQPLSSNPRVAILDGGLPEKHPIDRWLNSYKILDSEADDDVEANEHGLAVTSSFLFGPIQPNGAGQRPFSYVDNIRVLDTKISTESPLELYRTLGLIEEVLLSRQYEFINLSLGPDLPIEDTDVHAWTSVIDDLLSDGETFMTIAVGNNGDMDRPSGNARIQVPSDCVNGISVGSASDINENWKRASYSAVGPGRSPGIVKPDLMAFGGDAEKYFHVLMPGETPTLAPQLGTSFASPHLLRSAVGIRAILGPNLSTLAIKALLVHSANQSEHDKFDVGWGKVPENIMDIITCPEGVARIVYQGELKPGKSLRASLPIPSSGLNGDVKIKATFCYASRTDPQDASTYTRAGLDVTFRPHADKKEVGKPNAKTRSFFKKDKYTTEQELRSDMGKWETVLNDQCRIRGSSLYEPVFDIHYNAREAGASTTGAEKIKYALIITVEAPKHAKLFEDILASYPSALIPIQPEISLPIRV